MNLQQDVYLKLRRKIGFYRQRFREERAQVLWDQETNECRHKLLALKNKYQGETCFVLGNGPSLKNFDLTRLAGQFVFGSNGMLHFLDQMPFKLSFYTVEDPLTLKDYSEKIRALPCLKFFPWDNQVGLSSDPLSYPVHFKKSYLSDKDPAFPYFSLDAASHAYWGGTVVFFSLQLAYFLGFKRIYILGVDLNYQVPVDKPKNGLFYVSDGSITNHFDPSYHPPGKKWAAPDLDRMQRCFLHAYKALSSQGVEVFNLSKESKMQGVAFTTLQS